MVIDDPADIHHIAFVHFGYFGHIRLVREFAPNITAPSIAAKIYVERTFRDMNSVMLPSGNLAEKVFPTKSLMNLAWLTLFFCWTWNLGATAAFTIDTHLLDRGRASSR